MPKEKYMKIYYLNLEIGKKSSWQNVGGHVSHSAGDMILKSTHCGLFYFLIKEIWNDQMVKQEIDTILEQRR